MASYTTQLGDADPVTIDYEIDPNDEDQLDNIEKLGSAKSKRNLYLKQSDKYMTLDYPMTESKQQEWIIYRKALRDMDFSDLDNLSYPTKPE